VSGPKQGRRTRPSPGTGEPVSGGTAAGGRAAKAGGTPPQKRGLQRAKRVRQTGRSAEAAMNKDQGHDPGARWRVEDGTATPAGREGAESREGAPHKSRDRRGRQEQAGGNKPRRGSWHGGEGRRSAGENSSARGSRYGQDPRRARRGGAAGQRAGKKDAAHDGGEHGGTMQAQARGQAPARA